MVPFKILVVFYTTQKKKIRNILTDLTFVYSTKGFSSVSIEIQFPTRIFNDVTEIQLMFPVRLRFNIRSELTCRVCCIMKIWTNVSI